MGAIRWKVTKTDLDKPAEGRDCYTVKDAVMQKEFGYSHCVIVWQWRSDWTLWCSECKTIPRSCAHVEAVRRYLKKEGKEEE